MRRGEIPNAKNQRQKNSNSEHNHESVHWGCGVLLRSSTETRQGAASGASCNWAARFDCRFHCLSCFGNLAFGGVKA
jgi:hypothetical protein